MLLSYLPCADGWSLDDKVLAAWLLVHVRGCRETEDSKLSCSLSVDCLWHKHVVAWRGALVTSQPVSLKARLWPSPVGVREDAGLTGVVLKTISSPVILQEKQSLLKAQALKLKALKKQQCSIIFQMCADAKVCVSGFCSYTVWNSLHSVTLWGFYLMAGENG